MYMSWCVIMFKYSSCAHVWKDHPYGPYGDVVKGLAEPVCLCMICVSSSAQCVWLQPPQITYGIMSNTDIL